MSRVLPRECLKAMAAVLRRFINSPITSALHRWSFCYVQAVGVVSKERRPTTTNGLHTYG